MQGGKKEATTANDPRRQRRTRVLKFHAILHTAAAKSAVGLGLLPYLIMNSNMLRPRIGREEEREQGEGPRKQR